MKHYFVLLSLLVGLISCEHEYLTDADKQAAIDREKIEKYLLDNNLTADTTENGVYYIILKEGIGTTTPNAYNSSNTVKVFYKGYLLDSTHVVFDSTANSPYEFNLSRTIKGWQDGMTKMKKGCEARLIIPSRYGYGSAKQTKEFFVDSVNGVAVYETRTTIPAYSVLIFDITLLSFKNMDQK